MVLVKISRILHLKRNHNTPCHLTTFQSVLDQLEIDQSDISEFELEYRLVDGTVYEVELEIDGDDDE